MHSVDRKILVLIIFIIGIGVFLGLYFSANRPQSTLNAVPTPAAQVEPVTDTSNPTGKLKANYELTATQSGQTALALLQQSAEVETKNYGSAGDFVTMINGLEGSNEYYWAFYLNGVYAEKGASQTTLKEGDTIKFVYEAVSLSN